MLDLQLFKDILGFDSTSGSERLLSEHLLRTLKAEKVQSWELEDGTQNLLFSWGTPRVVFCSHMDTVPPYIAPRIEGDRIWGRGSCDAKGQILALYTACKQLESEGCSDFGLLLVSGEETGSWGAKAFAKTDFRAPFLIIGEPTENRMVSASKGTKSFKLFFTGEPFHSGYPQFGHSAIDYFGDFLNAMRGLRFPEDPLLGDTTWNIGRLISDNPQNILSPGLFCRLYFRTTFASDEAVAALLPDWADNGTEPWQKALSVQAVGGDSPARYLTLEGFPSGPAAFGSDAPHLTNFENRIICGPGSIRFAHRDDEHVDIPDLEAAVRQYVSFYKALI